MISLSFKKRIEWLEKKEKKRETGRQTEKGREEQSERMIGNGIWYILVGNMQFVR